jgi:adenosine deaminase
VVGADFCGVPWEGEIKQFTELFQVCRDKNIKLTIHTAELPCHTYETGDIMHFKPERVGHFCYATDQEIELLNSYGGLIEICPTSNIITGELASMGEHAIDRFEKLGAKFSICTDDMLLFKKNVSEEIYYMSEHHPNIFTFDRIEQI